jgi:hypothetical protein
MRNGRPSSDSQTVFSGREDSSFRSYPWALSGHTKKLGSKVDKHILAELLSWETVGALLHYLYSIAIFDDFMK